MVGDGTLARWLIAWVDLVRQHSVATLATCAGLTVLAAGYAANTLGVDSDTIELFPEKLPARQHHDAFVALFPNLENALLVVIDAETPELARDAAARLRAELAADEHFEDVYLPGGGQFFERNALLYRSVDELERFADRLASIQPIVAELERDGSIANVASLVEEGLRQIDVRGTQDELWADILDRIGHASVEVYGEHPLAVSWEEVILRGSSLEVVKRRVIVAHPVLDFSQALPAAAPLAAIRSAAERIGIGPESGVVVRITGNPALAYEETLSLTWDIGVAGLFCLLIVCGVLTIALGSAKLVAAEMLTLLVGLVWTGAFAGAAVGNLNVISVAAGVLFVGLGVDFGIHLGMRYAELLRGGLEHPEALRESTRHVGGSLVLCAITTSIGFFAFLPTDYRGVAELGLITGVGLVIIAALTFTLFPALLTAVFRVDPRKLANRSLRFDGHRIQSATRWLSSRSLQVRRISVAAAIAGAALLPGTRFDANIVGMRDPSTESVRAFNDLLADSGAASPWHANSVVASLAEADTLKQELSALDVVDRAISLSDYIPSDQDEKLEILADIAFLLDVGPADPASRPRPSTELQVDSLRKLHAFIDGIVPPGESSPLRASLLDLRDKLAHFLERIEADEAPETALRDLEEILLSALPAQLERLHRSLETEGVESGDLPQRLVERMLSADGRARIQVFPRENLDDDAAFSRFVRGVQRVDPSTTGVAVNLVEFGRVTREAFVQALSTAILVIAAILWILWRNVREVLVVLAPLFLAAVLTGAAMVAVGVPFNFFNVVVIPLLLGAGVDSGIHLVERSREEGVIEGGILGTTTARAIFFSALTTITSFGSLAFSSHVGLSGLGVLLTVGMSLTVLCNLVVLPALLERGGKELVRR